MTSDSIYIGSVPIWRGTYSKFSKYYKQNCVTMCSCVFQCISDMIQNVPPLALDDAEKGTYKFVNQGGWECIIDNLELYNRTHEAIEAVAKCEQVTKTAMDFHAIAEEAEKTRVKNELIRIDSENERVRKENIRIDAENKRIDAEKLRIKAEDQRIQDEKTRRDKEVIREKNEASRIQTEADCKKATEHANAAGDLADEVWQHPAKIGEDGFWYEWNTDTKQYEKTSDFALGSELFPDFVIDVDLMYLQVHSYIDDTDRYDIDENGILSIAIINTVK